MKDATILPILGSLIQPMLFSKKYKIQIINPCKESWERMQSSDTGRFCDACAKNVTDFSILSEREIAAYLKKKPQNSCGRFKSSQLEQFYTVKPEIQLSAQKRFFQYLISLLLTSKAFINKAIGQTDTVKMEQGDSLNLSAITDTGGVDTAIIAKADTLPDSTAYVWDEKALEIQVLPGKIFSDSTYLIQMVMGDFAPSPVNESEFDLGKIFKDTCKKMFSKKEVSVEKNNRPMPPKAPVKESQERLTGVLPEEIRRKNAGENNRD